MPIDPRELWPSLPAPLQNEILKDLTAILQEVINEQIRACHARSFGSQSDHLHPPVEPAPSPQQLGEPAPPVRLAAARSDTVKDRKEKQTQERTKLFTDARPELQQRVSEYLKSVLRDHGETAFESGRGGAHQAAMVGASIKDGLKERGINLSTLNLNNERVARVAQEIVGNLPRDLRNARERNAAFDRERMIERNGFDRAGEREHQALPHSAHRIREQDLQESRAAREPHQLKHALQAVEIAQSFDVEFVEQKVASHLRRAHPVQPLHFPPLIHDNRNQHAQSHEIRQDKERVMRLTLSR